VGAGPELLDEADALALAGGVVDGADASEEGGDHVGEGDVLGVVPVLGVFVDAEVEDIAFEDVDGVGGCGDQLAGVVEAAVDLGVDELEPVDAAEARHEGEAVAGAELLAAFVVADADDVGGELFEELLGEFGDGVVAGGGFAFGLKVVEEGGLAFLVGEDEGGLPVEGVFALEEGPLALFVGAGFGEGGGVVGLEVRLEVGAEGGGFAVGGSGQTREELLQAGFSSRRLLRLERDEGLKHSEWLLSEFRESGCLAGCGAVGEGARVAVAAAMLGGIARGGGVSRREGGEQGQGEDGGESQKR
jgi:hypothetical protein